MAHTIKPISTIKGEDAKKFYNLLYCDFMKENTEQEIVVKRKKYEEMKKKYDVVVKASNGVFL